MNESQELVWRLSAAQWRVIAPHVPPPVIHRRGGARSIVEERRCFEALLWRLALQKKWNDIDTATFASAHTCWRRYGEWTRVGALDAMWMAFLSTLPPRARIAWEKLVAEKGFAPLQRHLKPNQRELRRRAELARFLRPEYYRVPYEQVPQYCPGVGEVPCDLA